MLLCLDQVLATNHQFGNIGSCLELNSEDLSNHLELVLYSIPSPAPAGLISPRTKEGLSATCRGSSGFPGHCQVSFYHGAIW